jgi:hypothetical protein
MLQFPGERQKVCFTVATEIITLPGHLRVLFDKIYEGEPVSGNAWVVWQRVLQARVQEPFFAKRLAAVQLACRTLRQEVSDLPAGTGSITARTKSSWVEAIDQLNSLTIPGEFHLQIPQWKEKARQSDITLLDTMHVYYNLHNMFFELDTEQAKKLAAQLGTLSDALKATEVDGRIRSFFIRILEELRFALVNMEIFGFENAWAESANFVAGALRFRNELEGNSNLRANVTATACEVMQYLADIGGGKQGGAPIGEAARVLLGAAPTISAEV